MDLCEKCDNALKLENNLKPKCGYCKRHYCDICMIGHFRWCPFCDSYTCENCFSWDDKKFHIVCENCIDKKSREL